MKSNSIIVIAKEISGNDIDIVNEITTCIEDEGAYFESHIEQFEDRGIDEFEDFEEEASLSWIALVDILMSKGYVCECDWKCSVEDLIYNLEELTNVKSRDLEIESDWFDEDSEITEWLEILDNKWKAKGVGVFAIDIEVVGG